MNKIFNKDLLADQFIRLFLAFFCPPLAVADKGCMVFLPVFLLYLIQVTALGTVLFFGLYVAWWLFFECPLLLQLHGFLVDLCMQIQGPNPTWICQVLCALGLDVVYFTAVLLAWCISSFIFTLISSFVNLVLGFLPILIAVISCITTDEADSLKPGKVLGPISRNGLFSMTAFRQLFLGANRIALCFIYPPLAVSDMGWRKMLLVFLINLLGWYPGVIAVFFCIVKKYSAARTVMKGA